MVSARGRPTSPHCFRERCDNKRVTVRNSSLAFMRQSGKMFISRSRAWQRFPPKKKSIKLRQKIGARAGRANFSIDGGKIAITAHRSTRELFYIQNKIYTKVFILDKGDIKRSRSISLDKKAFCGHRWRRTATELRERQRQPSSVLLRRRHKTSLTS